MIRSLKSLDRELEGLQSRLLALVKKTQQRQLTNMKSILGLGDKTVALSVESSQTHYLEIWDEKWYSAVGHYKGH
ncbi:hypothetical protein [Flagellimonas okinawensis]|uniref:Uncharacterized protein n=1 Tax=Flagellimonas okinawensis TaxID=3031324 RepID=A0ABT5XS25_9FLAO|nr:hypothetical protein [[Muricauda] okinawensis]MDF0708612.1 hypothetical protein [[Muricauda] okinawensis]